MSPTDYERTGAVCLTHSLPIEVVRFSQIALQLHKKLLRIRGQPAHKPKNNFNIKQNRHQRFADGKPAFYEKVNQNLIIL
jgi:hypothetical protein